MPGYNIPTFNLVCNINTGGEFPGTFRLESPCALAVFKKVGAVSTGGTGEIGVPLLTMWLLLPKLTDIRGPFINEGDGPADYVECPAGSGRIYLVAMVDDSGKGYMNEYRFAILQQQSMPIPQP